MQRKKIMVLVATFISLSAVLVGVAISTQNVDLKTIADDKHNSSCVFNHYDAVTPTATRHGSKEFWACCSAHHGFLLEAPEEGTIHDMGAFSGHYFDELDSSDARYIPTTYTDTYVVTFIVDGEVYTTENVASGKKAHRPANPNKTGYTFNGWYDEYDDYWVFNGFVVTEDITLYAKFDANEYTITFDTDGGECDLATLSVTYDSEFTLPVATKSGYKFVGWFYEQEKFESGIYKIDSDITVVANWNDLYTIYFDTNGGNPIEPINMNSTTITSLPTPFKTDERFLGWMINNQVIELPYENQEATDITFVAKWSETIGDYKIADNNDGTATIMRYFGSETDIVMPDVLDGLTISKIETEAFYGNTTIKSIKLSKNLSIIEDSAFENCTSLESIHFCNGMPNEGYGQNLLFGCPSLKHISIDCVDFKLTRFFGDDENNIPSPLEVELYYTDNYALPMTELFNGFVGIELDVILADGWPLIPSSFFLNLFCLKSIAIPNSVTSIGDSAFKGCSNITSIVIPKSVTSIKSYLFEGCTSLSVVNVPGNIAETMLNKVFSKCSSLEYVVFGGNEDEWQLFYQRCRYNSDASSFTDATVIFNAVGIPVRVNDGQYIYLIDEFDNVYGLKSINREFETKDLANDFLGKTIISLGNKAFYSCASLTSITIPDSVTYIGHEAFHYCTSLTSITIPDSVTFIGSYAFIGCTSLTSITIPDSVTSIGSGVFMNCSSLTSITISKSVTALYSNFMNCSSLTSITIPDSVTSIGTQTFCGCSSLTSITIPDSVTSIGYGAFYSCTSLTSITIPDSVTSINFATFCGCSSLTSITIPNSVTSIGSYAFTDCSSLTFVYFKGTQTQWKKINYNFGTGSKAKIYYYSDSKPTDTINKYWHYVDGVPTVW